MEESDFDSMDQEYLDRLFEKYEDEEPKKPKNQIKLDPTDESFLKITEDFVYNYKTKYKNGFVQFEIEEIFKLFPGINIEKFDNAMMGNTCQMSEKDGLINYHCDVLTALRCGIENRDITFLEWD